MPDLVLARAWFKRAHAVASQALARTIDQDMTAAQISASDAVLAAPHP